VQIDVDFEVFKALTALRESEADTYSHVLRRILNLPDQMIRLGDLAAPGIRLGVWFGNVHFPDGTRFRATYKGQTFTAEIRDERWVDQDGVPRNSPSEAAGAISGTNVNGWRFWSAQRPGDTEWYKLDELK
jgi:hypothetical protein